MADVYAADDHVRLLALNESNLKELIENDSRIAAKVLMAMSRGLCVKLIERSQGGRAGWREIPSGGSRNGIHAAQRR